MHIYDILLFIFRILISKLQVKIFYSSLFFIIIFNNCSVHVDTNSNVNSKFNFSSFNNSFVNNVYRLDKPILTVDMMAGMTKLKQVSRSFFAL